MENEMSDWAKGYSAAAKEMSDLLGIKLYDDWGLTDHAAIQKRMMPDRSYQTHDRAMCEELYHSMVLPHVTEEIQRYHCVLGAISQYTYEDIEFFVHFTNRAARGEKWQNTFDTISQTIERYTERRLHWAPSLNTLLTIEKAVIDRFPQSRYMLMQGYFR